MKSKGKIYKIALILLIIWLAIVSIDFGLVFVFHEKPLFAMYEFNSTEDGSGNYYGIGYNFEIEGHFDDCDCILEGVVEAEAYIFQKSIYHKKRVWVP